MALPNLQYCKPLLLLNSDNLIRVDAFMTDKNTKSKTKNKNTDLTFIDLFAGCGGLSLGLINAGFKGIFAIEKNADAFSTLTYNLKNKQKMDNFSWPSWLPCKNMTTEEALSEYREKIQGLNGTIDLIAGGPPCQGFSLRGRRNSNDPRNKLTEEYIDFVSIVQPKFLLLENVKGFQIAFKNKQKPYSDYVISKLEKLKGCNYKVFKKTLPASNFGVPQHRQRFIMIAVRADIYKSLKLNKHTNEDFFNLIDKKAAFFKEACGLSHDETTVAEAISDLESKNKKLKTNQDHKQIVYSQPKELNPYLKLMRKKVNENYTPNSLKLPIHRKETLEKYHYILKHNEKGCRISDDIKKKFKITKQCLYLLSPDKLSNTVTTLPNDILHYTEPRMLTVRESARLQSFPDWYSFKGPYSTGGKKRRIDCPRYTQVGNAVPPLMAEIIGLAIKDLILEVNNDN